MPNGAHHNFTPAGFAMTILRVIGFFALLLVFVMTLTYFYFEAAVDKEFDANLSLVVPAFLYLSFIGGWAVAYHKYFRFPKNQKVLLLGIGIGALIVPVLIGLFRLSTGEMNFPEVLHVLAEGAILGSALGAAMQMYVLVIVLRYLFRRRLPF